MWSPNRSTYFLTWAPIVDLTNIASHFLNFLTVVRQLCTFRPSSISHRYVEVLLSFLFAPFRIIKIALQFSLRS